ncbi:MAG: GWxTD domain-containing protein, partial [Candidatus Aminicenantes bacterium]|nr:GWxTD domain-containing protein [Candidatus Aminicenantes bacterium]
MKRTPLLVLFALLLAPGLAAGQSKVSVKDLPEKYRDWLDLVHYHIQPVEKDVFMKLTGNRDRDIFIETFWKQRDPTPGTPANEYKDELLKRFR